MKRFKEILQKLWAGLDGNKTIVGQALIILLTQFPLPQPYQAIALALIGLFTGVALKQHLVDKQMYRTDRK